MGLKNGFIFGADCAPLCEVDDDDDGVEVDNGSAVGLTTTSLRCLKYGFILGQSM